MSSKQEAIPRWQITIDYVETCNCDFGCPCNFSGFPTDGFCRGIILHHIKYGFFGETNLGGIDVVYIGSWPGAIHEGDGTLKIYVSRDTNEEQRDAVVRIFYGRARGNGPFALLTSTVKYYLEPEFVQVNRVINGKKSSFSVPGTLEVETDSFKNPVTHEESDVSISVPKGFIWREAQACYTKKMRIITPNISFDHSGKNAFFATNLKFEGP
jgi:hypothetical protein